MKSALAAFVIAVLVAAGCKRAPDPVAKPEEFGALPAFRFTDQAGRPFGSDELQGSVWVGNTFFTSCRSICPPLMEAVGRLRARLDASPVNFVSITVDPDNDTPEILAAYARDHAAQKIDGERWRLLSAPYSDTRALVVDGFKTAMGTPPTGRSDGFDIEHSAKLFLVDAQGHFRGWYSSDGPGIESLVQAIQAVQL